MPDRLRLALVLAALLVPAIAAVAPAAPRTSLNDIEDEVMCTVCGVPLNLAESVPQADRQRAFIRRLVAAGASKAEVKRRLVDQYGPAVLATPARRGFSLAAWAVPLLAGLAALVLLAVALPRWRRRPAAAPPPGAGISPAEARRLDEDLARYDG